ncbi:MAG: hypothetical protein ACRDIC_00810 [bacterium]
MAKSGQRKCLCCGDFFDPDRRNLGRQRYCSNAECRRASKAASQAAWVAQPQNLHYFRDPVHVARTQAWRAAHPGYSRGKPAALQDSLITQVPDSIEECCNRGEIPEPGETSALQDLLNAPTPVLAGLIAHLFDLALQDDMAATTRRLVQLGHDLIKRSRDEQAPEASAAPRAAAPSARAVQLG